MPGLTKKQKNDLFNKIGKLAAKRISFLKQSDELLYREISEKTGLLQPRISEILRDEKINEPMLRGLLKGGIVSIQELIENLELSKEEQVFLKEFVVHENGDQLGRLIVELKRLGGNPIEVIRSAIKELKK